MAGADVYERLIVERRGPVGWLVFDRPDVGNALDARMMTELEDAWRELDADPAVRVIVNAGEGKNFQTGLDVAALSRDKEAMSEQSRRTRDAELRFTAWHNQVWKPVIAAVQGIACGGAFYMLGETEFIIASEDAVFFDPHVTYGMTAAFEPIHLLAKMPFQEVMRMALLGADERMSAARAREIGLVSEVVPKDELRERAGWAARVIADAPPLAVQGTMRALWTALDMPRAQGLGMANLFTRIGTDADALRAGQERFASGRRPKWRLR
jgi:enoyl-CoA hydratase